MTSMILILEASWHVKRIKTRKELKQPTIGETSKLLTTIRRRSDGRSPHSAGRTLLETVYTHITPAGDHDTLDTGTVVGEY